MQPAFEAMDSIWPDWFTTHRSKWIPQGLFIIYPMNCLSRRLEKTNTTLINEMKKYYGSFLDFSDLEKKKMFLEGKGALVFDVRNRKIYSIVSPRCTEEALNLFLVEINKVSIAPWKLVMWHGVDVKGNPIYHTDVMFTLFKDHALVSLECVKDPKEKEMLMSELTDASKNIDLPYKIMDVSYAELKNMCCNIFNLRNVENESWIFMSKTAYNGFNKQHLEELMKYYKISYTEIDILESVGGGSCRCLLAEVF